LLCLAAWLHGAQEAGYFGGGKRAMMPGRERFEREVSNLYAFHFLDRMPGLKKPVAQRVAARF
jgi:hypothetical protein